MLTSLPQYLMYLTIDAKKVLRTMNERLSRVKIDANWKKRYANLFVVWLKILLLYHKNTSKTVTEHLTFFQSPLVDGETSSTYCL